jgi:multiple sugar transport system permease protein
MKLLSSLNSGRWLWKQRHRQMFTGYIFIFPVCVGFIIFYLGPMLAVIGLSFMKYGVFEPPQFCGFENFIKMASDSRLLIAFKNTFVFAFFAVIGNVGLGLIFAVAINRKLPKPVLYFLRSAYFAPALVGLVYVAIIWQFLYHRDIGIINYYLEFFRIGPINWLTSKSWALTSVIILDVWKNVGMAMLIFLAGLQGISRDYYEAASLEGANQFYMFRKITLPLLSPTLFFVITMYLIGALRVFDSIVVLTQGGPGDASRSVVMYIYEKGFKSFVFGYASAISLVLLLIIGLVTLLQFYMSRKWVYYEE